MTAVAGEGGAVAVRRARVVRLGLLWAACAWLAVPAAGAAAGSPAAVADSSATRFAAYADALEGFGFSGQLLVAEHGRVLFERSCGWADARHHVPMTPRTRLAVGSITKNFVAAAVLVLESRGRLRLGDRLADRLPDVPADKSGITLEQLLCHTAGFATDIPDGLDAATRDEVVRAVLAQPLTASPGAGFHYSNAGFDLLAAVVERAAGEPFDTFAARELLSRAGLTRSGVAGTGSLAAGPGAVGGNEWQPVADWRDWPQGWSGTGSGRMVSTAHELWQWAEHLWDGRTFGAELFARMRTVHATAADSTRYGLGLWVQERAQAGPLIVIGGEVPGYSAECRLDPDAQRIVVVCTNQEQFGLPTHRRQIANTLTQLARGAAAALPPVVAPFEPGSARALEGTWRLESGGRIEIWEEHGRLRLGARGQDAVDLFQSGVPAAVAKRHETARRAQGVLRAAINADTSALHIVLPGADYEFLWPFLRDQLRAHRATFGELLGATSLGALDMPWPGGTRSWARLQFPDHESNVMLGWTAGRLSDVALDDGRPYPVLLGVAPLAGGGHAAFDLASARTTRLSLERTADGSDRLHVRGESDEAVAVPLH